jgi:hypothetical protein
MQTDGLAEFTQHSAWLRKPLKKRMDKPLINNREYIVLIFNAINLKHIIIVDG